MLNKSLSQLRKEIKDEIFNKLNAEIGVGKTLHDVQSVIYGDRVNQGNLKIPAVWVLPASHIPQTTGGNRVTHDFTFDFVALTRDNNPDKGIELAEDLAARVYDIITQDRTLNNVVYDVIPGNIEPSKILDSTKQLYWSSISVSFRVQRYQ